MTVTVEFNGQSVTTVFGDVKAIGVPSETELAWANAAADPEWVRDRDEMLALREGAYEVLDDLTPGQT